MKKMKKEKKEENLARKIEETLISVGIEIARKGEGALFIVSENCKYKRLLKQKIEKFSIFDVGAKKLLVSIATIDGAVIINKQGIVLDYGAKIDSKKVFKGYGTRHAAAYSASLNKDTIAILVSQEEKKVKIFKKGKIIVQIDALQKDVEKQISKVNDILESIGVGTLSTISVAVLAPTLGISLVPGIVFFGIPYYLFKKYFSGELRKFK
ncbi:MAG: DNA integrity scanning protein DisA nucleotide-binding domain protein [Candidatus Pacearchaeota archaeon]